MIANSQTCKKATQLFYVQSSNICLAMHSIGQSSIIVFIFDMLNVPAMQQCPCVDVAHEELL
jgi:hypothetical protein